MIKKTITVTDLRNVNGDSDASFKVAKITNSVDYTIDEYMSVDEVQVLCNKPDWTVNIVGR